MDSQTDCFSQKVENRDVRRDGKRLWITLWKLGISFLDYVDFIRKKGVFHNCTSMENKKQNTESVNRIIHRIVDKTEGLFT